MYFRFLVPKDMSVGHFIYILSGRLRLDPGKALFIFVSDTLPQTCKFWLRNFTSCFFNTIFLLKGPLLAVFLNVFLSCSLFVGLCLWNIQGWRWISVHVLQQREDVWLCCRCGVTAGNSPLCILKSKYCSVVSSLNLLSNVVNYQTWSRFNQIVRVHSHQYEQISSVCFFYCLFSGQLKTIKSKIGNVVSSCKAECSWQP